MEFGGNTCLFVSDLNISDCASWVQALGSLVALGVAVGIPLFQHAHAVRETRKRELDRAMLAASSALLRVGPIIGCLSAVTQTLTELKPGNCRQICEITLRLLRSVRLPDETQILDIAAVNRGVAVAISRGRDHVGHAVMALELAANSRMDDESLARQMHPVRSSAALALGLFQESKVGLLEYLDEKEGEVVKVGAPPAKGS